MNWSRSFSVLSLLAAVPLAASLAAPAVAQPYPAEPYYGGVISPNEVMRTVIGMGLQPASEPRLRGRVWIVRGIGREGTIVRVVMDSHTGRVVDMQAINRAGPYGGPYGPGVQPGPYQPDPHYVMRDAYPSDERPYPAPRPGQVYQDEPPYPGPRGAAVPDDDDDDMPGSQPVPQPRGYVPHSSVTPPAQPQVSSKPETKRLAARPPLPKARPNDIKIDTAKKDDGKQDAAKTEAPKAAESKSEPKQKSEQAAVPLTSPKDPETTASIAAANKKAETHAKAEAKPEANKTEAKKDASVPVQPLE
jgi:hypothetical protein